MTLRGRGSGVRPLSHARPSAGCRPVGLGPDSVTHVALKYFASGWWTMKASVDCSGCSCSSSESSTPIRPGSSRSTSVARSARSGQAG